MAVFLYIVYVVVALLRESYLEFVAAEYYCDKCRWEAESKRNGTYKLGQSPHG